MSKKLILALSILAMVFAGCNESDDESKDGGTNDNTGGGSSSGNLTKIAYVKGLYNITSGGDEAYLHISDAGLVATYDFQGDSVDNGSNCYEKNPSNLNAPINNKTLTQNDSETRFEIGSY
ncbi:MAG: hypothetical protein OIF32_12865, partial [Campylobacterales bacterium]|nr:hypothetical protein [Campylobacterales bacterium]